MASGRLGKVVVAAGGTSAVYTNSSGAEASCTILATSENGATMTLQLDDSNTAVILSTTLVSEAYNQRYLQYLASNTTLTTGASAYIGRLAHTDTTVSNTLFKLFYEFFDSSANATYGATVANAGDNAFRMSPNIINSYEVWKTLGTTKLVVPTSRGVSAYNYRLTVFEESQFPDADTYYKLALNRDDQNSATPNLRSNDYSYGACGIAVDPYETAYALAVSAHTSGYMRALAYRYSGNQSGAWYTNSRTSDSIIYQRLTGNSSIQPSAATPVPTLMAQNRLYSFDRTANGAQMMLWTASDAQYTQNNVTTFINNLVHYTQTRSITVNMEGARDGGSIVYFQYNPVDKLHYIGLAQGNSTNTIHLFTMDRAVLQAKNNADHLEVAFTGIENDYSAWGYTYVGTVPSFTASASLAFSNASTTSSCMRIGTSLWAATISRMGSTIAAETIYSTDLKTWKTAAAYYSPNDYTGTIDATTIKSSSGAVVASKSNIANLTQTGVLESSLPFTQYERTGLVLSNGDRVVVRNEDSTNSMVMQVMGFEGT